MHRNGNCRFCKRISSLTKKIGIWPIFFRVKIRILIKIVFRQLAGIWKHRLLCWVPGPKLEVIGENFDLSATFCVLSARISIYRRLFRFYRRESRFIGDFSGYRPKFQFIGYFPGFIGQNLNLSVTFQNNKLFPKMSNHNAIP